MVKIVTANEIREAEKNADTQKLIALAAAGCARKIKKLITHTVIF